MKKPRLCYCPKGTTCYPSNECPNKPTTLENICVCGNRGYSALVNNEHFKDCPNYKPTTLREFFKEKFKKVFILHDKQDCRYTYLVEDVTDDVIDFFLAHNTELIKRIEGLKVNRGKKKYDGNNLKSACDFYRIAADSWTEIIRYENGHDSALDEVINLINQNK